MSENQVDVFTMSDVCQMLKEFVDEKPIMVVYTVCFVFLAVLIVSMGLYYNISQYTKSCYNLNNMKRDFGNMKKM
ncbi:hypothetical protein A3Q56_02869 [Intoshia linei]|uniref:Uncharacterized protein n=1 Tax=Intoshia linei TaxID=1819745 RepID=A0A177B6V9_9BILA|nr:hypothetical protein A3Q56_02869 [Intoshia linei]